MKRFSLFLCFIGACALLLAGCNQTASTSSSSSAAASSSSSAAAASSAAQSVASASAAPAAHDVKQLLATLSEAASLGGTISMSELDLTATGHISKDNIVAWAGAESQLASENGGIVIVIQAKPGTAESFVSQFEEFRDAKASDDRYAEYATAIANTKEARIVVKGDYVVYAVSATGQDGGFAALDSAIETAFA